MWRYQIPVPQGIGSIVRVEAPEPQPGPGQVLVAMRAWSLNYRDLAMPRGGYPGNDKVRRDPPLVPLSDGVGRVVAVGPGVRSPQVGERVVSCFFQDWVDGELTQQGMRSALGGACDGVLAERVVLSARGCTLAPACLTDAEAATLPCAGVTAWAALTAAGLRPGQTVLVLGTGGVSLFALQLAKAAGARVIITSSRADKLERAADLGADELIDYVKCPNWDEQVLALTAGVGVDNVIEVGGAGTLERSMRAARVSGCVSLIGVLSGEPEAQPSPLAALFRRLTVRGIYVGSSQMQRQLTSALEVSAASAGVTGPGTHRFPLRPVVDRVFDANEVAEVRSAYRYLKSGKHFGKVVLQLGG